MKRYYTLLILVAVIITIAGCSLNNYNSTLDPSDSAANLDNQHLPEHSDSTNRNVGTGEHAETTSSQSPQLLSPPPESNPSPEEQEPFSNLPPPENGRRYKDEEILSIFESEGFHVLEIRNFSNTTVVQYTPPGTYDSNEGRYRWSRFVWFDRLTGERKMICPAIDAVDFDVRINREVWILTRGIVNGTQYFPNVFHSLYEKHDGLDFFRNTNEEYFMPIDRSITIGVSRREALTGINFGVDEIAFTFSWQPGYEGEFMAGSSTIPEMNIAFEDGNCIITMHKTILAEDFVMPDVGEGDSMRSFLSAECDGTDTVVTLKIAEDVTRYNIAASETPNEYFPCALLKLMRGEFHKYPSGW
ncbi:MAG: hypothetical protein GX193_02510 [Clostridiales bacterium]|jgi:hypothetical protein|nr:hypothetical protein [Clostridiales bacterium]